MFLSCFKTEPLYLYMQTKFMTCVVEGEPLNYNIIEEAFLLYELLKVICEYVII